MTKNRLTRGLLLATASALAVTLSACSSDDAGATDSSASGDSPAAEESSPSAEGSGATESSSPAAEPAADEPFGAGCSSVPADGEGSFAGMTDDPVAVAASNNPVLSTLVQAAVQANLVDTLNTTPDVTVIAPANPAFEAVPADQLQAVLADNAALTQLLTHHVIPGRLAPDQLAGTHTTVAGDEVTIEGSSEAFTIAQTVTGTPASVVCGNVQTANATVYIVDQVLASTA
ncbi:fasciclin domain-containing protein [Geodermatophilus sp. SYSU D00710]